MPSAGSRDLAPSGSTFNLRVSWVVLAEQVDISYCDHCIRFSHQVPLPFSHTAYHADSANASPLVERAQPTIALLSEQAMLLLLEAYKNNDGRGDDIWYNLLGIAKVRGTALDIPFLVQQAVVLDSSDLLEEALKEAGLEQP